MENLGINFEMIIHYVIHNKCDFPSDELIQFAHFCVFWHI